MRISLSPTFLVPGLASAAVLAFAASAQATPPAAPVFYCPKAAAPPPQACPPVHAAASRSVRRVRAARTHAKHAARRPARTARVERPYNPEDDGVSASQALSYKYQLAHGGYAMAGHGHMCCHRRGGRDSVHDEGAYHRSESYAESRGEWRGGRDWDDTGWSQRTDDYGREDSGAEDRDQYGRGGDWRDDRDRGDRDWSDRDRDEYRDLDRREWGRGDRGRDDSDRDWRAHAGSGEPVYGEDEGRSWEGERYGREFSRHASRGYVYGEEDGVPYGWSWGDRGRWGDDRYGHGHYVVGAYAGRRGVWYDTIDQAVPYAGRDADGYLTWPGKTPR